MTDYSTQYSSDPLTPISPSEKYSNPLVVNPSYDSNEIKPAKSVTYETPKEKIYVFALFFFITGLITTVSMILEVFKNSEWPIYVHFLPLLLLIIGYYAGGDASIYTKIHIDNSIGIITITKVKTFCCFNVSVKIQINKIDQVFIRENEVKGNEDTRINFKIIFRLLNGNEIERYKFDKKDECKKAFNIIKCGLPQNIIFNDDLVH